MTMCNHDPAFTNDGRCSKCHPGKRVVMVQHHDGTREIVTTNGWFVNAAVAVEAVKPLADAKLAEYNAYRAELTDDEIALMEAMTK